MAIGINVQQFDFIDRPKPEAIEIAVKQLNLLGAITSGKLYELTDIGRKMAKFPLDPKYSKMILTASSFGCLEEVRSFAYFTMKTDFSKNSETLKFFQILSVIAVLSGEDVFINNIHDSERRGDALVAHAKFENQLGDHLTMLNVFKAYSKAERAKTWCHENFLNIRNLTYATEVRNQLKEICTRLELEFNSCGNNFDQVRNKNLTLSRDRGIHCNA